MSVSFGVSSFQLAHISILVSIVRRPKRKEFLDAKDMISNENKG